MLKDFLAAIFRRTPASMRRLLSRFSQPRFTVTSGAVITDDQNRVLLLEHVFRAGSGWGIPGGFIRVAEQPDAALRRELREEVGLELERLEIALVRTLRRPKHIEIVFRCRAQGEARPRGLEVKSAAWFPLDALPETLSEDQRRMINRALADGAKRPE
jgi:ADP-ribose pyrophosphatase YjhB (NUDIX family)